MKTTETKSCPKVLPLLKENEDEEEKQIKEDLAKEKVKAELKFMEVRYKRHQNKITSTDTEIINHILQITCEDLEESLLQWQKKESQWDVSNNKRDFDFKEQWFVENWMTEKINPEREETNSHKKNRIYLMKEPEQPVIKTVMTKKSFRETKTTIKKTKKY